MLVALPPRHAVPVRLPDSSRGAGCTCRLDTPCLLHLPPGHAVPVRLAALTRRTAAVDTASQGGMCRLRRCVGAGSGPTRPEGRSRRVAPEVHRRGDLCCGELSRRIQPDKPPLRRCRVRRAAITRLPGSKYGALAAQVVRCFRRLSGCGQPPTRAARNRPAVEGSVEAGSAGAVRPGDPVHPPQRQHESAAESGDSRSQGWSTRRPMYRPPPEIYASESSQAWWSPAYWPPLPIRSDGEPSSMMRPCSSTITRSAVSTVDSR